MAIFDDYMQKEQAGNYNQQRLQRQQDEQARKDADLARTLAPYVADALKEIGKVAFKMGYINDYVENP